MLRYSGAKGTGGFTNIAYRTAFTNNQINYRYVMTRDTMYNREKVGPLANRVTMKAIYTKIIRGAGVKACLPKRRSLARKL